MCRLTAYIGTPIVAADLVTRPNHSIITQSFAARERLCETFSTPPCINGDGFGLGWYSPDLEHDHEPCIYRSTRPAWNDENLMQLSEKIQSHLLFAHVRAATPGSVVAERLCHPFRCGRYLFMHNGNVGGFDKVRRKLMDSLNDTCFEFAVANGASDTVVCFALFLNLIPDHTSTYNPDELRKKVELVVEQICSVKREMGVTEASLLNFVVSDGRMLLATRFVYDPLNANSSPASLYFATGAGYERKKGSSNGEYYMAQTDRRIKVVIATSEPLSDNHTDWVAVPRNNVLVVTPDLHLLVAPLGNSTAISLSLEHVLAIDNSFLPDDLKNSLGHSACRSAGLSSSPARHALPPSSGPCSLSSSGGSGHHPGVYNGRDRDSTYTRDRDSTYTTTHPPVLHRPNHVILGHSDSALALAVAGTSLYSGSQDGSIRVWNIETFTLDRVLQVAEGGYSVLAVSVDEAQGRLYTTSSDNKLRIWDLHTDSSPSEQLVGEAYFEAMGHPVALAVDPGSSGAGGSEIIYLGFQDTSVRWAAVDDVLQRTRRAKGGEALGPLHPERMGIGDYAMHHCGPVTALAIYDKYLISGAGDGFVKVWCLHSRTCLRTMHGHHGSVLTLIAVDGMVITGSRDATVKVWDLDSFACKRTLRSHNDDVLSLAKGGSFLFSGSADGQIVVWRLDTLTYYRSFKDADQGIQSLVTTPGGLLFSGLNGGMVLAWDMPQEPNTSFRSPSFRRETSIGDRSMSTSRSASRSGSANDLQALASALDHHHVHSTSSLTSPVPLNGNGNGAHPGLVRSPSPDLPEGPMCLSMEACLVELVAFQSVSLSEDDFHKEECWRCAKYLTSLLERMGASVKMVSLVEGRSPVVLARFGSDPSKPTITFYGHYDVVPATEVTWQSDPFELLAVNGYLYGRGVTDNKGPIMAMIFALQELRDAGRLDMNAVLLIEGEEENSSEGFREAVLQNLHWFRGTSLILQANSTWIDDETPCLTYGMRGTIHLEARVQGPKRNLHSGIDGGAVVEPLNDLVGLLATLVDSRGMVLVPDFYQDVKDVTTAELTAFDEVGMNLEGYKASLGVKGLTASTAREVLVSRWRQPTLSINQVETSNFTDSYSIIPKVARAKISIRTVPHQNPERLIELIRAHCKHEFGKRRSPNELFIDVKKVGDWWLGSQDADAFLMAETAITDVWGVQPRHVREGGTMPITAFLETLLKAPAIHLPLGQATDNAHLPNERIRYLNLINGKEVIKRILRQVAGTAAGDDKTELCDLAMPDLKRCASAPPLPSVSGGRSPLPVLPSFVMDPASGATAATRQREHAHTRQPSNGTHKVCP